jgi:hypothetical protein
MIVGSGIAFLVASLILDDEPTLKTAVLAAGVQLFKWLEHKLPLYQLLYELLYQLLLANSRGCLTHKQSTACLFPEEVCAVQPPAVMQHCA